MQERGGGRFHASGRLVLVPCGRVADRYSALASGRSEWRERKTGSSQVPVEARMARAVLAKCWPLQMPVRFGCGADISIARATRPRAVPARVADVQFPRSSSDERG